MTRITGGELRGRRLRVPGGVRPTSARVREALLSIWQPRLAGARLLDLFAGSGAVGLEAASRGAAEVTFVEGRRAVARRLAASVGALGLDRARVIRLDLPGGLRRWAAGEAAFDLVFADPPYEFAQYRELLAQIEPLLTASGEVAVEHAARFTLPETAPGLALLERRRYGESAVSRYRREGRG